MTIKKILPIIITIFLTISSISNATKNPIAISLENLMLPSVEKILARKNAEESLRTTQQATHDLEKLINELYEDATPIEHSLNDSLNQDVNSLCPECMHSIDESSDEKSKAYAFFCIHNKNTQK